MNVKPSLKTFQSVLDYDPETGLFHWKVGRSGGSEAGQIAGHIRRKGYVVIRFENHDYYGHHLAWLFVYGVWPPLLDHCDRNASNNRIHNLREATLSQNLANRKQRKRKEDLPKGVLRARNKFRAEIYFAKTRTHLGTFETAEQASSAYREAAQRIYGEFANA